MKKWFVAAVVAAVLMLWLVWQAWPADEAKASEVCMERATYYEMRIDGKPLFWFTNIRKGLPDNIVFSEDSVEKAVEAAMGYWTDSRGRAYASFTDTVMPSMRWESALDSAISREKEECDELAYYLKTHDVQDEGFDMVARYDKRLNRRLDHHLTVRKRLKEAKDKQLIKKGDFTIIMPIDSDSIARWPARLQHGSHAWAVVRTKHRHDSISSLSLATIHRMGLKHRLSFGERFSSLLHRARGKGMTAEVNRPLLSQDPPQEGHHAWLSPSGERFYEGHWKDGMRNGFGFSIGPPLGSQEVKLRIGEWKDDTFLGERLHYNSDRIYGIDISRYQHEVGKKKYRIDWNNLRITNLGRKSKKNVAGTVDYPVTFIYIKSTEGTSVTNKYFPADYAAARRRGFRVGAYHFFSVKSAGAAQAYYFLKNARFKSGDFPPVLDLEPTDRQISDIGGTAELFRRVRQWLTIVEKAVGQRPILYVNQRFINKHLPKAPDLKRNYPVWIARYGEYKPDVRLLFWQLAPDGRVSGIHGDVDINVFNGYSSEYEKFLSDIN